MKQPQPYELGAAAPRALTQYLGQPVPTASRRPRLDPRASSLSSAASLQPTTRKGLLLQNCDHKRLRADMGDADDADARTMQTISALPSEYDYLVWGPSPPEASITRLSGRTNGRSPPVVRMVPRDHCLIHGQGCCLLGLPDMGTGGFPLIDGAEFASAMQLLSYGARLQELTKLLTSGDSSTGHTLAEKDVLPTRTFFLALRSESASLSGTYDSYGFRS